MFSLFNALIFLAMTALGILLGLSGIDSTISITFALGIFSVYLALSLIPFLAVCVRRYHDLGKSAAFLLILLFPVIGTALVLVDMAKNGQPGTNQYGPSPKLPANTSSIG